jgi:hypothetical protein
MFENCFVERRNEISAPDYAASESSSRLTAARRLLSLSPAEAKGPASQARLSRRNGLLDRDLGTRLGLGREVLDAVVDDLANRLEELDP